MTTPIEQMIDSVVHPVEPPTEITDLPYVTHEGLLEVFDVKMKVYILSTGQRIIDKEDLEAFFGKDFINNIESYP